MLNRISSFLASAIFTLSFSVPATALDPIIEEMILTGDWQDIATTLEREEADSTDAVSTMLMGHATLVTNRNNVSYVLFLSKQEPEQLEAWKLWTQQFSQAHPHSAVAQYLAGDGEARSDNLNAAISRFTEALVLDPGLALAANARGVAHAISGNMDAALVDFFIARQLDPELADAHANFGTLAVLREFSISQGDGALSAFNEAIALNPSFAMAYNGRGSLLFGSGEFEQAALDFQQARNLAPFMVVAELNEGFAYSFASLAVTLASLEANPGTTLGSVFRQQSDSSAVTPTPILEALADHRRAQVGSSNAVLADAVYHAQYREAVERYPTASPADQQDSEGRFGRTAMMMGLANNRAGLQAQIGGRLAEQRVLNQQIPELIGRRLFSDRRQVVDDVAATAAGLAVTGATAPATVGLAATVGLSKVGMGEILIKFDRPNVAKFVQGAPTSNSVVDNVLSTIGSLGALSRGIRRTNLSNQIDARTAKWDRLAGENRLDQVKLISIGIALSNFNRQPVSDASSRTNLSQPIALRSDNGVPWHQIRNRLGGQFGGISALRGQRVGIVSVIGGSGPSLSDRVLQARLNNLGVVAPIISDSSNVSDVARQLGVIAILSSPTFPILQSKLQALGSSGKRLSLGIARPKTPLPKLPRRDLYADTIRSALPLDPPLPPPTSAASVVASSVPLQWRQITPISNVGGVLTKADAFVDQGNWPVLAGFGLAYK